MIRVENLSKSFRTEEVVALQSVVMAMMLAAVVQIVMAEAAVARLAARSLVIMMTMATGVS